VKQRHISLESPFHVELSPSTPDVDPVPHPFSRPHVPKSLRSAIHLVRRWRAPRLGSYAPVSMLELPEHRPVRASMPTIDFHTHLGRWLSNTGDWMEPDVGRLLDLMDSCNVTCLVNLDGRWGRELEDNLNRYDRAHPGRFFSFCHVDWRVLDEPDGPDLLVKSLRRSVAMGACGLKIWKDLGFTIEARGRRVLPDDPMLSSLWDAAGELGVPVLIHVADPVAFFHPVDRHNERVEELLRVPKTSRHTGGMSEFRRLVDSLERVVASHRDTAIVGAHATYVENLAWVSDMFDRYPNFYIDIAARAAELGRQPRATRALLTKHPNRVLFGTDIFPVRSSTYHTYFRLLETDDEAFPYSDEAVPPCGRWPIYGLDLPASILEHLYRKNAEHLLRLGRKLPRDPQESIAVPRGISHSL